MKQFKHLVNEQLASSDNAFAVFAGTLLHAATITHFMHFQTKSYATHVALGAFYVALPDLVDALVESYQGKYGIITNYPTSFEGTQLDPVSYIETLKTMVIVSRHTLPQDSEIQNDIDGIATLINSTLYKLRYLS